MTGAPLGFAAQQGHARPSWIRWLFGSAPVQKVCETEDESLLFTIQSHGGWAVRWDVLDADGQRVARLRYYYVAMPDPPPSGRYVSCLGGKLPRDPSGRVVVIRPAESLGSQMRFVALPTGEMPHWEELGTVSRRPDGIRITFADALEENPFVKMLLLAAVLVSER